MYLQSFFCRCLLVNGATKPLRSFASMHSWLKVIYVTPDCGIVKNHDLGLCDQPGDNL